MDTLLQDPSPVHEFLAHLDRFEFDADSGTEARHDENLPNFPGLTCCRRAGSCSFGGECLRRGLYRLAERAEGAPENRKPCRVDLRDRCKVCKKRNDKYQR